MNSLYYKSTALPLFILLTIGFTSPVSAEEVVSQNVNLEAGWNIVSTPMVLDSHEFSAEETSDNFDIYVLDASKSTGWATMADLGQTEFTPLYGYFINNKTGEDQTLIFNYDTTLEPNEKLFTRSFTAEGWYSIGVANAEYAKTQAADRVDTNNPSQILNLLAGKYTTAIDLTNGNDDIKNVSLSNDWNWKNPSEVNELNDLRDTKGYVVYVRGIDASYNGFQNDALVQEEVIPTELQFSISSGNPAAYHIMVDKNSVTTNQEILEYQIEAKNGDVELSELAINLQTGNESLESLVDKVRLVVNGVVFAESVVEADFTTIDMDFTFVSDSGISINEGETVTVEVLIDLKAQKSNYTSSGETIKAQVTEVLVKDTIAADIDGILESEQLTGSATGDVHTLVPKRIIIPFDGFTFDTDILGLEDNIGEFVLEFEVTAVGDDFYITDNVSSTTANKGIKYSVEGDKAMIAAALVSTADEDVDGVFTVQEGQTETFSLYVTVDPVVAGNFRVSLGEVWYSINTDGETDAEVYELMPEQYFSTSELEIKN